MDFIAAHLLVIIGFNPRAFWGKGEAIAIADTKFANGTPDHHDTFTGRVVNVVFGDRR